MAPRNKFGCPFLALVVLLLFVAVASSNSVKRHDNRAESRQERATTCTLPVFNNINRWAPATANCVSGGKLNVGDKCQVKCATGWLSSGGVVTAPFECTRAGLITPLFFVCNKADPTVCAASERPSSAGWSCDSTAFLGNYPSGTVCTVACGPGTSGTPARSVCNAGKWTGTAVPVCANSPCSASLVPSGWTCRGAAAGGNYADGTVCTRACADGFTGTASTATCSRGSWSTFTNPTCTPRTCSASLVPSGWTCRGAAAGGNYADGTVCTRACAEGFTGTASTATCSRGAWSTFTNPTCTPAGCKASLVPSGWTCQGTATGGNYADSTVCTKTCPNGSTGSPSTATCSRGAWGTFTNPTCSTATCTAAQRKPADGWSCTPAISPSATVAPAGTVCQKQPTCADFYTPTATLRSTCSGGVWSNPGAGSCKPLCPGTGCQAVDILDYSSGSPVPLTVCGKFWSYKDTLIRYNTGVTPSCTSLTLGSLTVKDIADRAFQGLSALQTLNFGIPTVTALRSGMFAGLGALTYFSVAGCTIKSIADNTWAPMVSLEKLWIVSNLQFPAVTTKTFQNLPKLKELTFNANFPPSIADRPFSALTALTSLSFDRDRLATITTATFAGLSNLKQLSLTDMKTTSIATNAFSMMTGLTSLELSQNPLTAITSDIFNGISNTLETLNLVMCTAINSGNSVGAFTNLNALKQIFLSGASIGCAWAKNSAQGNLQSAANCIDGTTR